jgi:hypothetical protein
VLGTLAAAGIAAVAVALRGGRPLGRLAGGAATAAAKSSVPRTSARFVMDPNACSCSLPAPVAGSACCCTFCVCWGGVSLAVVTARRLRRFGPSAVVSAAAASPALWCSALQLCRCSRVQGIFLHVVSNGSLLLRHRRAYLQDQLDGSAGGEGGGRCQPTLWLFGVGQLWHPKHASKVLRSVYTLAAMHPAFCLLQLLPKQIKRSANYCITSDQVHKLCDNSMHRAVSTRT